MLISSPLLGFPPVVSRVIVSLLQLSLPGLLSICFSLDGTFRTRDTTQLNASTMLLSKNYRLNWAHTLPKVHRKVFLRSARFLPQAISGISEWHRLPPGTHRLTPPSYVKWQRTFSEIKRRFVSSFLFCFLFLFRDWEHSKINLCLYFHQLLKPFYWYWLGIMSLKYDTYPTPTPTPSAGDSTKALPYANTTEAHPIRPARYHHLKLKSQSIL